MSKAQELKDKIQQLKEKRFEKVKEETIKAAKDEIAEKFTDTAYAIRKVNNRKYELVLLKYDIDSKKGYIEEVVPANNRVVALRFLDTISDLETLFLKKKRRKK
jgi:hypothetical protein